MFDTYRATSNKTRIETFPWFDRHCDATSYRATSNKTRIETHDAFNHLSSETYRATSNKTRIETSYANVLGMV